MNKGKTGISLIVLGNLLYALYIFSQKMKQVISEILAVEY